MSLHPVTSPINATVGPLVDSSGTPSDADSAPVLTVMVNGADTAQIASTTHPPAQTGLYRIAYDPAALNLGDRVEIRVDVTVGGTADTVVLGPWVLDATISTRSSHTAEEAGTQAAAAVLSDPANKLLTDATGQVQASNMRGTDNALLASGYTAPPTAESIATAVWGATTRSLTTFGTLAADVASAVWGAGSRTLTAISDSSGVTTLLSRLTSTRAGYLDKLDVTGTLAHSDAASTYMADVSDLLTSTAYTASLPANFGLLAIDGSGAVTDQDSGGGSSLTAQDVRDEIDAALLAYDSPTKAELDAALAGLGFSTLDEAGVVSALTTYGASTLDAGDLPDAPDNATVQAIRSDMIRKGTAYRYTNTGGDTADVTIGDTP